MPTKDALELDFFTAKTLSEALSEYVKNHKHEFRNEDWPRLTALSGVLQMHYSPTMPGETEPNF